MTCECLFSIGWLNSMDGMDDRYFRSFEVHDRSLECSENVYLTKYDESIYSLSYCDVRVQCRFQYHRNHAHMCDLPMDSSMELKHGIMLDWELVRFCCSIGIFSSL